MNKSKVGYISNIENEVMDNENYRAVLFTGKIQLVLMTLKPSEEIGMEVHADSDQFFRIEQGEAKVILNDVESLLQMDDILVVPAGTNHNIINNSKSVPLKLYTIYAPPTHPAGTVQKDKPAND